MVHINGPKEEAKYDKMSKVPVQGMGVPLMQVIYFLQFKLEDGTAMLDANCYGTSAVSWALIKYFKIRIQNTFYKLKICLSLNSLKD